MASESRVGGNVPRWSLAALTGLVATVLLWAATMLPWEDWTTFSIATTAVGMVHIGTCVLALVGHALRARAWRIQALVSLTYFAYLTWNLIVSASYVAELYGGLGRGVAASLGLVWMIVVLFTIPLSVWGLAVTGGLKFGRLSKAGISVGLVLAAVGIARNSGAATAVPTLQNSDPESVSAVLANVLPAPAPWDSDKSSIMTYEAAACAEPPSAETATIVSAFLAPDSTGQPMRRVECVQAPTLEAAAQTLGQRLTGALPGPIKLDVISGVQPLEHVVPIVDSMTLRPGLDGVCEGSRCLMPWQLLVVNAFKVNKPIPVIPELLFGFSAAGLRRMLAEPGKTGPIPVALEGLTRIETLSFVTDREGALHRLRRFREAGPELNAETLKKAVDGAERYIHSTQGDDGRFEYVLHPFSGIASYRGFSLARQAGTTLVVCEMANGKDSSRKVARAALEMLASTQRVHGDISALYYPKEKPVETIGLGDTALSTIAFLSCRDLVGDEFDEDIDRMTRFLLSMQRPDGGFYPRYDRQTGEPIPGPDPLYAVGQAVFALTLLEKATLEDNGIFAENAIVREAVERSMSYTATDYWNAFVSDFFFMEENWHCLAARASLRHHRHEGYEDFCLDYVKYKTRLILDENDGVDPDLVGGYGFGNVLLPHNTGSAGFGEAGSAALAIMEVRGMDRSFLETRMRLVLEFLLHHQWSDVNSFASSADRPIAGAFSEHMASAVIRIDYVQHSLAGMGHGGRMLGLLDGSSY